MPVLTTDGGVPMGLLDKVKGLIKGNKKQAAVAVDKAKGAVDQLSDVVEKKVGAKHADEVEKAAGKAKELIDKVDD
jgi:hypothetical protein